MNWKNIVKMSILSKQSRFNATSIKIPLVFFKARNNKNNPIIVWNHKRSQRAKAILRKNSKVTGIICYNNPTVWY